MLFLSTKIVRDDVYTSIHIEEYDTEARDTKLGPEEITRDIPNVGEDVLKYLDEDGIIQIGSEVKAGDILVGKVTPRVKQSLQPRKDSFVQSSVKRQEKSEIHLSVCLTVNAVLLLMLRCLPVQTAETNSSPV